MSQFVYFSLVFREREEKKLNILHPCQNFHRILEILNFVLVFNQALSNSIKLPSFKGWSYLAFTKAFVKACGILILSLGNAIIVAHLFRSKRISKRGVLKFY